MTYDAMEEVFEEVEFWGKPALFSDVRIQRDTVPLGLHHYEIRHTDEDWGRPCELGYGILVNHFGTLITNEAIQLGPDDHLDIDAEAINFTDGDCQTITAYMEKYPPVQKNALEQRLSERMERELEDYKEVLREETPDDVIANAYGLVYKEHFISLLANHRLTLEQLQNLDSLKFPLEDVYQEWLKYDDGHMNELAKFFQNYANRLPPQANLAPVANGRSDSGVYTRWEPDHGEMPWLDGHDKISHSTEQNPSTPTPRKRDEWER